MGIGQVCVHACSGAHGMRHAMEHRACQGYVRNVNITWNEDCYGRGGMRNARAAGWMPRLGGMGYAMGRGRRAFNREQDSCQGEL